SSQVIRCGTVDAPLNGHVTLSKTSYGGEARFSCDEGFLVTGDDILRCTAQGTWSAQAPECISIVRCPPLALTANDGRAPVIYATERGPIPPSLGSYDVGVLAEIRCLPDYALTDENLLTCLDSGQWDLPLPECVPVPTATEPSTAHLLIRVNRRPDVPFWKHLKDYLFHGCTATVPRRLSLFCYTAGGTIAIGTSNWTDLAGYTLHTDVAQIDVKLLAHLVRTLQQPDVRGLRPDNLFQFVLYGAVGAIPPAARYPPQVEDAYRYVVCQFIDVILMDRELNYDDEIVVDIGREENTNTKIKYLLKHVAQHIYQEYQRRLEERSARETAALKKIIALAEVMPPVVATTPPPTTTTTTTPAPTPRCPLSHLAFPPIDSHVVAAVLRHPAGPSLTFETLARSGLHAEPGDRVQYGCADGFSMRGSGVTVCGTDGRWSTEVGFCEGAVCEHPPSRPNMLIALESRDRQYYVDDEIAYRCETGYTIKGHPVIKCQPNGRWTHLMARCTRISCGRPKNLAVGNIVAGQSFMYGDTLRVRCQLRTADITCQANGQWTTVDGCW
uniref:Sushi domain-containing protein n=1 Tax=Anopheles dirus TaxID=7168 RepID=A0A182MZZ5_9DIPT